MKRELAILLGVLGPFAVLVALAFAYTSRAPEALPTLVNEPAPSVRAEEHHAPAVRVAEVRAPTVRPVEGPAPTADAGPEAEPLPPEIAEPIRAITPEFTRCFADQRSRAQAQVDVTLKFRPTRDGGFAETSLTSTWQDPYLTACLTDVLEEVGFHPTGRETFEPATHVFHFQPPLRAPPKAH